MNAEELRMFLFNDLPTEIVGEVSSSLIINLLKKIKSLFEQKKVNRNDNADIADIKAILEEMHRSLDMPGEDIQNGERNVMVKNIFGSSVTITQK
ncbi:hypothetical protein HQ42_07875 [Porphyromonas gulae]|uniref:hypothetical protein n=1 Tax=Porphyromonas gulae TaxID=111105 RepID=UPI00052E1F79|nr:hypothetical protein [Porphyromonas gulae]KGO02232.1 hypothetical protein HQ42_07875 [Porphyromonas gulae]